MLLMRPLTGIRGTVVAAAALVAVVLFARRNLRKRERMMQEGSAPDGAATD